MLGTGAVDGGEVVRGGRGSFDAESRDFDLDFRLTEPALFSSSLSEEL